MKLISYSRHRFPSEIIQHAVWLYFRFTLSYRDVEDLLAERGIGSIRRDLLDHVIVLNDRHLKKLLCRYAEYYNGYRTHLGLDKDTPIGRATQAVGSISALPQLGGLHHAYVRT